MRVYAPDYYHDFKCLMGACTHSCCKGWEVDIDPDTLAYYQTVPGEMGRRLQAAISCDETPHFVMTPQGDCPFLNSCGLCDIMGQLGLDKVSRICDEHPRFYNYYSDRQEIGLGLACEAVAKQLVQKQDMTTFICIEDDGSELLWPEECDFLDLRDDLFTILQNRNTPMQQRLTQMLTHCGLQLPAKTPAQWAALFETLERLDENWTVLLARLKTAPLQPIGEGWFETALEQLAVYFVWRHLTDGLDEDDIAGKLLFAAISVGMISALCCMEHAQKGRFTPDDMAEICRMYSAEIEYSDENVDKLIRTIRLV